MYCVLVHTPLFLTTLKSSYYCNASKQSGIHYFILDVLSKYSDKLSLLLCLSLHVCVSHIDICALTHYDANTHAFFVPHTHIPPPHLPSCSLNMQYTSRKSKSLKILNKSSVFDVHQCTTYRITTILLASTWNCHSMANEAFCRTDMFSLHQCTNRVAAATLDWSSYLSISWYHSTLPHRLHCNIKWLHISNHATKDNNK